MTRQRVLSFGVLSLFCFAAISTPATATPPGSRIWVAKSSPPSAPAGSGSAGANAGDGSFNDYGRVHGGGGGDGSGRAVGLRPAKLLWVIKTIDCGPPLVYGHNLTGVAASDFCPRVSNQCAVGALGQLPADPRVTTLAVIRQWSDGRQDYLGARCDVLTAAPRVTPLLVRQQIEKLVPRPGIGVAPPGGKTLVNLQTVLWANTPADRGLGTVTLLGTYRVALRVHVQQVAWAFGDGATETSDGPGLPYRKGEHCTTVTCAGHFGHVYASTGTMRITSRVTWSGQYSVNGGPWQDVAGTVDGPPASIQITVLEARGVLVADPTPS
jgi:hypothetical protein